MRCILNWRQLGWFLCTAVPGRCEWRFQGCNQPAQLASPHASPFVMQRSPSHNCPSSQMAGWLQVAVVEVAGCRMVRPSVWAITCHALTQRSPVCSSRASTGRSGISRTSCLTLTMQSPGVTGACVTSLIRRRAGESLTILCLPLAYDPCQEH